MLTARGYWFFLTVFLTLAAATFVNAVPLVLVCLTLLLWFLVEWFLFQLRLRLNANQLHLERTLLTTRGNVESLWVRQNVTMLVTVRSKASFGLSYARITDRLPELARLKEGGLRIEGTLALGKPLSLKYQLGAAAPGQLRFEGVKVQLADLQGFFTFTLFLRAPQIYRVLPAIARDAPHAAYVKRQNALPLIGTHRHARPGSSSELLDLRDYIPGDPPKTIAWKVSARRDRLITKEFESEVPIRCTLFCDVSNSVRIGPAGETALGRLVEIAAAITQANTAERDLTGLCLFDETGVRTSIAPGRGSKHLLKIFDVLTHAAGLQLRPTHATLSKLLPFAYGLLQEVYPEWLDRDVNSFPVWLPLWSPQPYATIPQPPLPSGLWWQAPWTWLHRRLRHSPLLAQHRRGWRFSRAYHREYRWRKEIAAVLAVYYHLGAGGLALLLEDDRLCIDYVQRFLAEHQVTSSYPLYDEQGRYLFAAPAKAAVLAKAILRAVTHGKDNELLVLCIDLLESTEQLEILERAVCVAKARHHQVVVVCPWPAAVPPPGQAVEPLAGLDLQRLLLRASTVRLHQAFAQVQRAFGRIGVPVIAASAGETVNWVLHRMRRLRVQERGVP